MSENEVLKNELGQTSQEKEKLQTNLETVLSELDEMKQNSENNSESLQLLESKIKLQEDEIQAQDKFITCLKEKNELLENHSKDNLEEAEKFQIQVSKMQENLHELELALFEQTSRNEGIFSIHIFQIES